MQRLGSRCGGGGANMKCSVLQWSWKTLMNIFISTSEVIRTRLCVHVLACISFLKL